MKHKIGTVSLFIFYCVHIVVSQPIHVSWLYSMSLGTIHEESTLGPGMSTLNSNMSTSTMGTNYTSRTTTRADINGRPFDVDSKAGASISWDVSSSVPLTFFVFFFNKTF